MTAQELKLLDEEYAQDVLQYEDEEVEEILDTLEELREGVVEYIEPQVTDLDRFDTDQVNLIALSDILE